MWTTRAFEARGNFKHILRFLPVATAAVVEGLRGLEMELSGTKNVVFASAPALAVKVAAACRSSLTLRVVRTACSLGVGLAGGRRSSAHILRQRLQRFCARLPRFAAARRLRVSTA